MFACLGIIMSLVQGGYVRRAMVNSELKIAKRSIILLIIGFITVGLSTYRYMLYLGLIPFAFAAASVIPCLTSAISKYGNKSQKGRLMGTVRALGALARALGPMACAISYWLFGSRNLLKIQPLIFQCRVVSKILLTFFAFGMNHWISKTVYN